MGSGGPAIEGVTTPDRRLSSSRSRQRGDQPPWAGACKWPHPAPLALARRSIARLLAIHTASSAHMNLAGSGPHSDAEGRPRMGLNLGRLLQQQGTEQSSGASACKRSCRSAAARRRDALYVAGSAGPGSMTTSHAPCHRQCRCWCRARSMIPGFGAVSRAHVASQTPPAPRSASGARALSACGARPSPARRGRSSSVKRASPRHPRRRARSRRREAARSGACAQHPQTEPNLQRAPSVRIVGKIMLNVLPRGAQRAAGAHPHGLELLGAVGIGSFPRASARPGRARRSGSAGRDR